MTGEIGRALVLASIGLATAGVVTGAAAGRTGSPSGRRWTVGLAVGFALCMIGANVVMEYALLARDFTVGYVDQVGSHDIPDHIAIVSLWSSLEGSILFWGFIIGVYTLGFIGLTAWRREHRDLIPWTLATLLSVGAFFAFLIAGPANPFETVVPMGSHTGPNPLLQNHILMIVHPPMLYLGYVGMTIPFAMGVAALLRGRLGAGWVRPMRHWMMVPWAFLTIGIVLGGWWAYEVLGWGGYWAWDPVENASLLPWLSATGFLHAAMLMERRGLLKAWTLVLLFSTFALTILGTFMTRSGVFNSVHAFTASAIGPTFLVFLTIILIGSVLLLGLRTHVLMADGKFTSFVSRDAMFVANNLLFVAFTFTVLLGTTFPLIVEALIDKQLSVGEPYFNSMTVPVMVAIVFLMGVGPALPWGRATREEVIAVLTVPAIAGIALMVLGIVLGVRDVWSALTLAAAGFASAVAIRDMVAPARALQRRRKLGLVEASVLAFQRGRRRYGGQIVHLGVALMAVSIAISSNYRVHSEQVVDRGESMTVGDYTLRFDGTTKREDPPRFDEDGEPRKGKAFRHVVAARMTVFQGDEELAVLEPAMNRYAGQMQPIGTPAVLSRIHEDLYLSVMQIDDGGGYVGLRAFVNPMVYWIWIAAGVMVLGCLVAAWPKRRTAAAAARAPSPAGPAGSSDAGGEQVA